MTSNKMEEEKPPSELLTNAQIDPFITDGVAKLKQLPIKDVMNLKNSVESKLNEYTTYLGSQNVDMHSSLVTPEGFPRSDIDVLQVRLVRRNVNMLRNDLTAIIEHSHELLKDYFNKDKVQEPMSAEVSTRTQLPSTLARTPPTIEFKIPFATLNEVAPGGPINVAGIENNDKLISIGDIHAGNHSKLRNVQMLVMRSEDKNVPVRILRGNEVLDFTLKPTRNWNGQGLLGCRLSEF